MSHANRPQHRERRFSAAGLHRLWSSAHGFWQQHLGADPDIVGRQLLLNGREVHCGWNYRLPEFDFPTGSKVWTPLDLNGTAKDDRENHYLTVFGRLEGWRFHISGPGEPGDDRREPGHNSIPRRNAGHGVSVRNTVEDLTVRFAAIYSRADGRGRLCSVAGLCECRQPATGARFRASKGDRSA